MQFLLYEIVARIVAIYLFFDCGRKLRNGFIERKITFITGDLFDVVDWLVNWKNLIFHRDTQPVRYWMQMGSKMLGLVACCVVAIFGWFHPTS